MHLPQTDMKRLLATALLLLPIIAPSIAQTPIFSDNLELFPRELKQVADLNNKKHVETLRKVEEAWPIDTIITPAHRERIAGHMKHIATILADNHDPLMRYMALIINFLEDSYASPQYIVWNQALEQLLNSDMFGLNALIDFLNLSENTIYRSVMHRTVAFEWKANRHPSYQMRFDNNQLTIAYNDISLVCRHRNDSVYIANTSGVYTPNTHSWRGKGGQISWWRSGYPENEIFVDIGHAYRLSMNKNTYTIDSVMFTNKDYFDRPNMGTVTDMLEKDYKSDNIQYPEFHSYDKWFSIGDLFDRVNYEGGFVMRGSSLIGTGSKDKLATIVIERDGKEFMRAEGNILIFQRHILNSDKASVRFRFGRDSLYHSGLNFNYNNKTRTVIISSTEKITTQSPMHSTHHKMNIWFNQMSWNIDKNKMVFSGFTGSANGQAQFESDNFFDEELFDNMMGASDRHPLFAIWAYSNQTGQTSFEATDLAVYLRKPVPQVKIEMMRIAQKGYILYDFSTDMIRTTEKLNNTILSRQKKIDFDVIKFDSYCQGATPNAILNIDSLHMQINGINQISVSQRQNVYIIPKNKTLTMKGNRDIDFAGYLRAGLFDFQGEQFRFNYDDFRIDLENVDIVKLDYQLNAYDNYGQRLLSEVTSTISKINGNILIDKPNNKSGLIKYPQYPIFNSTSESYVYYDKAFGGVYPRDSVYFKIYPFSYNNLNNFEKEDLVFKGIFFSKNILAPIEDSLVLRPDNSLGFVHHIPDEGFALYAGKGRAYNKIDVSQRGIMVDGRISYISSNIYSPEMYLFPDSMITLSNEFTIDKRTSGITYPQVRGQQHHIKWYPNRDKLHALRGAEPFNMYENKASLNGNLLLQPLGLSGSGQIDIEAAQLYSKLYEFNSDDFKSPSANLSLLNPKNNDPSFTTKNIKAHIDFIEKVGNFERNGASMFAAMPPLKYEAHLDRCTWDMGSSNLTMLTPKRQDYVPGSRFYTRNMHPSDTAQLGSLFYSVKYGEDSLYFLAPQANYNTASAELIAEHVERVFSADAMIMPHKQHVEVSAEERMRPLANSVVLADIDSMYHRFYNATVSIAGRKFYGGQGDYDYIDERDSVQTLHFAEITTDSTIHTLAKADVAAPDSFTLSPNFGYFGKIFLRGPERFMRYQGFAMPIYNCPSSKAEWFSFDAHIDPRRIMIPVGEKTRSQYLAFLTNGSVVREDTIKLYGGFFQKRHDYADAPMVQASGWLTYNPKSDRFIIAPQLKHQHPDTIGNAVMLQKGLCFMLSEGTINLPVNLGQVKFINSGSITHNMAENTINIGMVSKMNFFFNQPSLELIANRILKDTKLQPTNLNTRSFRRAMLDFFPDTKKLPEIYSKLALFGRFENIPKELESTITFAELRLTWNDANKSFITKGKLGIATIGGIQVNKYVDGYLEIFKRRSGDVFNLLIKVDGQYYGFVYTRSTMQVVSSDSEFTASINALKSKETKMKTKSNEPAYKYLVGTVREQNIVLDRYKQLTTGLESVMEFSADDEEQASPEANPEETPAAQPAASEQ